MVVKRGYKQTEVGVIPENWELRTLDSLGRRGRPAIKAGPFGSSITKGTYVAEGYKVYGQEQVIRGDYSYGDYYIPKARFNELRSCAVEPGDILLSLVGTAGRVLLIPPGAPEGIINPRLIRFSFDPNVISSRFFKLLFEADTYQDILSRNAQGGTMGVLNAGLLRPISIPLPPLCEQEAIAEALSDADALIESLEQLVAKKRQFKQGAMQELLTGRTRMPGFEIKHGYKQAEAGVIPEDWDMHRLGEGIKLTSGHHILAQHCNADGDGVAYITGPADFPNGMIQHTKYTTKPGTICGTNDILVTVKGSGAGALVLSDATYCISRQLMAVRVLSWSTQFVFFSLLRDAALFGAAATGLIPGLSRGDILNKRIPLPPTKAEQEAIAAILSDMDAEIAALGAKLAKTHQIKRGMLQELLTGRIRLV